MRPQNCVLAIDIGTTALKAAVINIDGAVLDFARVEFAKFEAHDEKFSEKWYLALKEACEKMCGVVCDVRAVCVSGNGPTIVFADGTTLLWNAEAEGRHCENSGLIEAGRSDNSKSVQCENFLEQPQGIEAVAVISSEVEKSFSKSIFLPRILAAKKLYPALWQIEQKIFSGPEFLINKLCGAEITILPEERFAAAYWNDKILDALEIPREKLCPFLPSGKIAGTLKPEVSEELHLPRDIPVIGAGPDFIAALVGTNTLEVGKMCDRAGSSEGINLCTPSPVYGENIRTLPSVIAGLWNASYLIPDPGDTAEEKATNFAKGISVLKTCTTKQKAVAFPASASASASKNIPASASASASATVTITGGQARDENLIQQKADAAGIKIAVQQITDAELLGDAAFAFMALGEFDSIKSAAEKICKTTKIFFPKNPTQILKNEALKNF